MERYSQFRDRGSGIAPSLPIPVEALGLQTPLRILLFCFRLPLFIFITLSYFLILQWLPYRIAGEKGCSMVSLKQQQARLPQPGSVIASSFTSPIDAVYLAAIFDPIFTASYPNTRQVERISLFQAILRAFAFPATQPAPGARMVDVSTLVEQYPNRPIVLFPECTTTNGRGILTLGNSLLGVPPKTKIFPPTHCIRVRIAESVTNSHNAIDATPKSTFNTNYLDALDQNGQEEQVSPSEKALLDNVGESLARLGRVKRVGLGVKEKQEFSRAWSQSRRTW
ncbi:hypothetical protein N7453_008419 [Penicillium expansum]|nr:hypothetical protein N7453_008419 [Penicillium expansum]